MSVSPPPVCCPTSRSCWCPAQAASCPVRTEKFPGCCPWQLSAAGWAPLRARTPSPALHLECGAVPGRATPLGLLWRRQREIMWQMTSSRGGPMCPTAYCSLTLTWTALLTSQPGIFTHRWFTVLKHKDEIKEATWHKSCWVFSELFQLIQVNELDLSHTFNSLFFYIILPLKTR